MPCLLQPFENAGYVEGNVNEECGSSYRNTNYLWLSVSDCVKERMRDYTYRWILRPSLVVVQRRCHLSHLGTPPQEVQNRRIGITLAAEEMRLCQISILLHVWQSGNGDIRR